MDQFFQAGTIAIYLYLAAQVVGLCIAIPFTIYALYKIFKDRP